MNLFLHHVVQLFFIISIEVEGCDCFFLSELFVLIYERHIKSQIVAFCVHIKILFKFMNIFDGEFLFPGISETNRRIY